MGNPLEKYFPVEERQDGVYIKVSHEMQGTLRIEDIVTDLQRALITNYDAEKIKDIISRGRGAFENAGPPFEYYNVDLDKYVDLTVSPMKASVSLNSSCINDDIKPTVTSLLFCLRRKGIIFGLKADAVRDIVTNTLYDREIAIAEGKEPKSGDDARLEFDVDVNKDARPHQEIGGKVDYRDIRTVVLVSQGKVIARKMPFGQGVPGMDVTGKELPPTPGKDIQIKPGKNAYVSEDGKFLIAAKSGYVYREGDLINVGEQLTIDKDVDFSVGNIKYTGDVDIKGNVLPGFVVEADGNILIKGEVESARIVSRGGAVTIEKGIIGKGDMVVAAKKDITVHFAQAALLSAEGSLNIDKYCLHCDITCGGLLGLQPHSAVVGGTVKSFSKIEIGTSGNEKGIETKLVVVDKEEQAIGDKIRDLELLREKLSKELDPIKKQLHTKAAILKQTGGQVTQRQTEELKKWLDVYNKLAVKLKYVQDKVQQLTAELKKPRIYNGYVKISGDVFSGTEISLYGMVKVIKIPLINKLFRIKDGAVTAEG